MDTRVRDISLAPPADASDEGWQRVCRPVLSHYGEIVRRADFGARSVAYFGHIRSEAPMILLPLDL